MYHIHGLSISSNTTKVLYVAEELGIDYEFTDMDFSKREHKTPEHLARHPLGKLPTLTHNGKHLFESNAICRYLAVTEKSNLYGGEPYDRALIDQWMNFFTCHLGRHFNTYAFEAVAKEKFGFGTRNEAVEKEALEFIKQQLPPANSHLQSSKYFVGDSLTIADLYGFAYTENAEMGQIDLSPYPTFAKWYQGIKERKSVAKAWKRLGRG